ncbi:LysM peptidoglycan-binding domain-containing protein [Bacillus sp. AK031]
MTTITTKRKQRIADMRRGKSRQKTKRVAAATAAGTVAALLMMNAKAGACSTEYTVKKNDTLYSLAQKYNVSVEQLREANGLTSDKILSGQQLLVPDKPMVESQGMHLVEKGDTLYSLAKKHGTTVGQLKKQNNLASDQINIGQHISIVPIEQPAGEMYTVVPGDALWGISHRFGVGPKEIAKTNGMKKEMVLIGQNLVIPGEAEVTEAEVIGVADSFTVEFMYHGQEFTLKVPYGSAADYQNMSGRVVNVIHKNGALISLF